MVSLRCSEKLKLAQEAPVLPLLTPGGLMMSSKELLYYRILSLNCSFVGVTGDWILKSAHECSDTFLSRKVLQW